MNASAAKLIRPPGNTSRPGRCTECGQPFATPERWLCEDCRLSSEVVTGNRSPELQHFLRLSRTEQEAAIRALAASGMSDHTVAAAARLSVEQVRRILVMSDSQRAQ